MKLPILILLLFISGIGRAQTDSVRVQPDTLIRNAEARIDSLQKSFESTSDSIRQTYTDKVRKLSQLRQKYVLQIDSIKNKRPSTPVNPLDTLNTPAELTRYTKNLDSLDRQLENVQRKTTAKLDSVKNTVTQKLAALKLPKGSQGKVDDLANAMDNVNLPAFNTDITARTGITIPDISGNLPGLDLPNTNLPGMSMNGIPGTDIKTPDVAGQLPTSNLNSDKLNDLTGKAGDLQKQVTEVTSSPEAMGKALEGKAAEQLKGLPEQRLPDAAGLPGGIPKTNEEAKAQLLDMAKKEAVNHFAGKEVVLASAMEKMGKFKMKYNSVNSLADIKDEKNHNALKGKPLRERLVPALTLQFQSWQDFMLDVNPSLGYKLNPKIVAGLGWNQRIAFNISDRTFNRYSTVHGVRSYGEYNFKKGFGFRVDLECMNTPIKNLDLATDAPPQRDWVWSALIGIKQKYPIYKKLKGNAQLMYNIVDKDHRSPYTDRLNWRIGLEFGIKKKKAEKNK